MVQVMLLKLETKRGARLGCRARDFVMLSLFCRILEFVIRLLL